MNYSVTCSCGAVHAVTATQAGATLRCTCARSIDVPPLSTLRRSAGESPYPQNTIEKIRAMIHNGELPSGEVCPFSGRPADDTILLHVQCERSWVRGSDASDTDTKILYVLLFGWIGALFASRKTGPRQEMGRDTSVDVPVRIASSVRAKLLGTRRQSALKALLKQTPIYAQLLEEFPAARVTMH